MIQASKALEIAQQYQAVQEYVKEIDRRIQAAAAGGKTHCDYMMRDNIKIGDKSYCSCDIVANYLRENGYKVMFQSTYCMDIVELAISWNEEDIKEEEASANNS